MLSALDLARSHRSRRTDACAGVIDLCAEAIAERESDVGAFVTLDLDGARKAAQAPSLKDKPLRGLPVALKDIFDTADLPTEYGSPIYAGYRPAGRRLAGRADPPRRRHADRQDRDHRVRPHSIPARRAIRTTSRIRRAARRPARRRRRRGLLPDRDRQPDRRLGDPARELLRRRRLQAVIPAAADRRHEMRVLASRHRGPVRRRGRGRGLRRRRHERPRPARRRPAAVVAAHRRAARAALARRPATT